MAWPRLLSMPAGLAEQIGHRFVQAPMMRVFGIAAFVFSLAIAAAGNAAAASTPPVAFSVDAHAYGDRLQISGDASVPDGAWIIFVAYRKRQPERRIRGYTRVKDRHFVAHVNIAGWPAGAITVDANFQIRLPDDREQPRAVIARYGANGQRMRGVNVVKGGNAFRAAVASATAVKR